MLDDLNLQRPYKNRILAIIPITTIGASKLPGSATGAGGNETVSGSEPVNVNGSVVLCIN
jgi:hypothetical protein